jgi:hypothetical protein
MHFSSTDLPVPEPPITTIITRRDVEVDAAQHPLGPGLWDAAQRFEGIRREGLVMK